MLRKSKYVQEIDLGDGRLALVSNWTGSMVALSVGASKLWQDLVNGEIKGFPSPEIAAQVRRLERGRFLVPADFDEETAIKKEWTSFRERTDVLTAILVTTYECNLACVYCYEDLENSIHGCMDEQVAAATLDYALERIGNGHYHALRLEFFGGEPFLYPGLMRFMIEEAEKRLPAGVELIISATTNGTLLTREMVDYLAGHNCYGIQVTVDGPQAVHDRRRPYRQNGGSTYAAILDNVAYAQTKLQVSIQVNIDKDNWPDIPALFDDLAGKGAASWNAGLRLGPVEPVTKACATYRNTCLAPPELAPMMLELYPLAIERDLKVFLDPVAFQPQFCHAYSPHAFLVDCRGDIFKCATLLPQFRIGNVFSSPPVTPLVNQWLNRSPLELPECRDCELVGFCGGGCITMALNEGKGWEGAYCPYHKYRFADFVRYYIDLKEKMPGRWAGGNPSQLKCKGTR